MPGMARRLAVRHAQALAGPYGIILTTDADCRVSDDWIASNLAEIDAGADAVAGMAILDPGMRRCCRGNSSSTPRNRNFRCIAG